MGEIIVNSISINKNIINIKNDFLKYLTEVTQATNINIFLDSHLKNFKQMINQQRNSCNELEFYQFIETFSNAEIFEFLKDIFETEKYNEKFKEIIKEYDESKINLNNLKKCFCSYIFNISTGILIAGFNKEDMFPLI